MKNDDECTSAVEEGSGNVLADLGLGDADNLFARAKLGFAVLLPSSKGSPGGQEEGERHERSVRRLGKRLHADYRGARPSPRTLDLPG